MRYIPRNCIPPQATLARPILGINGEILVQQGMPMMESYIKHMEKLGIEGAYVNDPISEDVEVVSALSDELRSYAVKNVFSVYSKAATRDKNTRKNSMMIVNTAKMIVDEILSHGDTVLNLFDIKAYDSYTFYHCVDVTVLSVVIGIAMDMNRTDLEQLAYASLLHDIGKIFIDSSIINKPGKLTDEEFKVIENHSKDGYNYIKDKFYESMPELSAIGVLEHHERVNGTGYPDNKRGNQITKYGRVIAVADVYDALISNRPYREGMFPVEAMEYIQGNCGKQFDYEIVDYFSKKVALFPVGTCVKLSDGSIGLVTENFEGFAQRPSVKIFQHKGQNIKPYHLNLSTESFDKTIISTVSV